MTGTLRVRETGAPLEGLLVELWDRDLIRNPLGKLSPTKRAKVTYTTHDFSDLELESQPDLYVRVWLVERSSCCWTRVKWFDPTQRAGLLTWRSAVGCSINRTLRSS